MLRAALAAALAFAFSAAASAVLIDGSDGSRDVAPFPQPVLDNIGARGSLSAIYLGNGVVLTANHVGAGRSTEPSTRTCREARSGSPTRTEPMQIS